MASAAALCERVGAEERRGGARYPGVGPRHGGRCSPEIDEAVARAARCPSGRLASLCAVSRVPSPSRGSRRLVEAALASVGRADGEEARSAWSPRMETPGEGRRSQE